MAALQGWQGRVQTLDQNDNPTIFPVVRWQVTWQTEKIDLTNAEDSYDSTTGLGYHTWQQSYQTLQANFDCLWDTTLNPINFQGAEWLFVGKTVELELYLLQGSANNFWQLDKFLIESLTMESEIRGVVKYSVTGCQLTKPAVSSYYPFN